MKSLALAARLPVRPHGAPRWLPGLLAMLACALSLLAGPALATATPAADRLSAQTVPVADDDALAQALAEAVALADAMERSLAPPEPLDLGAPATAAQELPRACCITGDADEDSPDRDWALLAPVAGIAAEPVRTAAFAFQGWPLRTTPPPQRPPRARA